MQTSAKACPAIREIPGRSDAERALAAALTGGRRSFCHAALFLPDHIVEMLDAGEFETADRAVLGFCQDLLRVLPPNARLFRWSASALVVLLERAGQPEEVAAEVRRLPVVARRQVFPLGRIAGLDRLSREMDLCVARNL